MSVFWLILSIPIANSDKSIDPSNALKKPSTSNPGVTQPASINNNALITNANNPNVSIVSGNDINCKTGLMKVLINARITQTSIALKKFSTLIPGITQATNITASVYAIHFKNKFNMFSPFVLYVEFNPFFIC